MQGKTETEGRDRRGAIIDAAIKQLTSGGLAGFSARSVAAAGKLSKSAVHYYFEDMNALLDEAEAEIARRYFHRVRAAAEARLDPIDRFWHAVDIYYRPFNDNLAMTSQWLEYWIDATRRGKGANAERIQNDLSMIFAVLLESLDVGDHAGKARALTSYFIGALMRQMTSPIAIEVHRVAISALCGVPLPGAAKAVAAAVTPPAASRPAWGGGEPARLQPAAEGLDVVRADGVATILFDRVEKANALTEEVLARFADALAVVDADESIRTLVLRGAGERVFASGSDLGEIQAKGATGYAEGLYAKSGAPQISAMSKPVIAAINGDCIGGGVLLAIAADLRIAVSTAHFGIPVGMLGFAFPVEAVDRLVGLVGAGQASRLLFTGVRIDAQEALRIGLVEQVVDRADFDRAISEATGAIGRMSAPSLRASKLAVRSSSDAGLAADAQRQFRAAWASSEADERLARALAGKNPK